MILLFSALRKPDEIRTFSFRFDLLEFGLDFLNFVCAKGDVILSAHVIDRDGFIELPLEAFDGQPCSAPIQELEKEWQALLNQPVHPRSTVDQERLEWTLRWIHLCEKQLANQARMIKKLEDLLQWTKKRLVLHPEKSSLIDHYQAQLAFYHERETNFQTRHKWITQRLTDLLAA